MTGEAGQWVVGLSWGEPPLSLNKHLIRGHENRVAWEIREDTRLRVLAARIPLQERVRVTLHWQPLVDRTRDVETRCRRWKHCATGSWTPESCSTTTRSGWSSRCR